MTSTPIQWPAPAARDARVPKALDPAQQPDDGRFAGLKVRVGAGLRRLAFGAISLGLALLAVCAKANPGYSAIDLGSLGGPTSYGAGINASGQVVGYSELAGNVFPRAFATGADGAAMTDLGSLGGQPVYGQGINNSGQVVGFSGTASGMVHGFIVGTPGGAMTDLGTLGGTLSAARSINNLGRVVGYSLTTGNAGNRAFITGSNGGAMRDLGTLGGLESDARDINDNGQVVGVSHTTGNLARHAFITGVNGGPMRSLGTLPGAIESEALAINASGQVVGMSTVVGGSTGASFSSHAFITGPDGGPMTDLGTLGGADSAAFDINASGHVVGWSSIGGASNAFHAFVTGANGAGMVDLNSLVSLTNGVYLFSARGINDAGQIVAQGSDGHAYLLTPISAVPEPAAAALSLTGLVVVALASRRSRRPLREWPSRRAAE